MKRKTVTGVLLGPILLSGCATTPCAVESKTPGLEKVSIRFTTPAETANFAAWFNTHSDVQLASDGSVNVVQNGSVLNDMNDEPSAFHAIIWGGNFEGTDVTHGSTPLPAGEYMFGMFDEYNGTAYQGWLNVNNNTDDYLDLLREWRNTIHAQKAWLGYDHKLNGDFASADPTYFKNYGKQIRMIKKLEKRINDAIEIEKKDRLRQIQQYASVLQHAEVLLTPSVVDIDHPSTRPAINSDELDRVGDGQPLTKIITVADYHKSIEKLHRVNDLRRDLERNRRVFEEEVKRLQRRKRYYTITDHLYHHDKAFVQNERSLQDAIGVIDKIDRQLDDHRNRAYALAFVAGLFAPEVTEELFAQETQDLQHDRVVLEERMRQLDYRYDQLPPDSRRRVNVESDRQTIAAAIDKLDKELARIDSARLAIHTLRDSAETIHRQGTARVLTASIFDGTLPAFVTDAIERESVMTIRLQAGAKYSGYAQSRPARMPQHTATSQSAFTGLGSPMVGPVFVKPPLQRSRNTTINASAQPSQSSRRSDNTLSAKPNQWTARKASYAEPSFATRVEPTGDTGDPNGVLWDDCCVDTFASGNASPRPALASSPAKPEQHWVSQTSAPAPRHTRRRVMVSSVRSERMSEAKRVEPTGDTGDPNGVLWDDCCVDTFASGNASPRPALASSPAKPEQHWVSQTSAPAPRRTRRRVMGSSIRSENMSDAKRVEPASGNGDSKGVLWDDCCDY